MEPNKEQQSSPYTPEGRESWDEKEKVLLIETSEKLRPEIKAVEFYMTSGSILVEGSDIQSPELTTRIFVSADSEEEAKSHLNKQKGETIKVNTEGNTVMIDAEGDTSEISIGGMDFGQGNVVEIGGDIIGSMSIEGNNVIIGGSTFDTSSGDTIVLPGVQKEVVLKVPKQDERKYLFDTKSATTEVRGVRGKCRAHSVSGDIEVSDFEGKLKINTTSGDVEVEKIEGELDFNSTSGDLEIDGFRGNLKIQGTSSDFELKDTQLEGQNSIRTLSGDIDISLSNESLAVRASTSSGKIKAPEGEHFKVTKDERPDNKSARVRRTTIKLGSSTNIVTVGGNRRKGLVEGHFGDNPSPSDQISINTLSGDIDISKS
jgi:hypothetical protein